MLHSKRVLHTTLAPAASQRAHGENTYWHLLIVYCNFSNLDSGVIISPASALIFRLRSSVDPSLPHKQFHFTAKMYLSPGLKPSLNYFDVR